MNAVFFFVVLLFLTVGGTVVNQCEESVDLPELVQINNCAESPCTIIAGKNVTCRLQFHAPTYLENIVPLATAYVSSLTLNYTLDQKDACDGVTNTPCPLAKGEYVEYFFQIVIPAFLSKISLDLEFALVDVDADARVLCFRTSLDVEKP